MKRLLSAILSLALLFSLGSVALAQNAGGSFNDVPAGEWYSEYVDVVYEAGVMNGAEDGNFRPDGTVTGAEMLTVCARLHHILNGGDGNLPQLPEEGITSLVYFEDDDGNKVAGFDDLEGWGTGSSYGNFGLFFEDEALERLQKNPKTVERITMHVNLEKTRSYTCNSAVDYDEDRVVYVVDTDEDDSFDYYLFERFIGISMTSDLFEGAWYDSVWWYIRQNVYKIEDDAPSEAADELSIMIWEQYPSDFDGYAEGMESPCNRALLLSYLADCIPQEELVPINNVKEVPDLDAELLRSFYNAGILSGVDDIGSFYGEGTLTRAQLAAVAARVLKPELRLELTLREVQYNGSITVHNFGGYLDKRVLRAFTQKSGYKVQYNTYDTPENLYTLLDSSKEADVIITRDYMLDRLRSEGFLAKLKNPPGITNNDKRLPGLESLSFDPDGEYTVPYLWGVFGILYSSDNTEAVKAWDSLFNGKYDKIIMPGDIRLCMAVALNHLGYSINTDDENELSAAFELLLEQKSRVDRYESEDKWMPHYISDKVGSLALSYSVQFYPYYKDLDSLNFLLPESGSIMFVDGAAIPADSKNNEGAELFIDFLCSSEVALKNAEFTGYLTPFSDVYKEISEMLQPSVDLSIYPQDGYAEKCETFLPLPDEVENIYEQYKDKLMSGMNLLFFHRAG